MHYRVHNVLEPSCFGMPVAFGPLFDTSQEAKELINKQLATVVNSESDLYPGGLRCRILILGTNKANRFCRTYLALVELLRELLKI